MSNRKELSDARRRLRQAAEELRAIEALPRAKGARVRWSNGVIWTRVGDDKWKADADDWFVYSSAHVSSLEWTKEPTRTEQSA